MTFSGTTNNAPDTTVKNDGWWPDLTLSDFQDLFRFPTEFSSLMVAERIRLGMAWTNRQLRDWRNAQEDAGRGALVLETSEALDEDAILLMYYRRAVFAYAKADLLQNFKTVNRRAEAENEAKEGEDTRRDIYQEAVDAIKKFKQLGSDQPDSPCEVVLI